jgi:hypothetical protein
MKLFLQIDIGDWKQRHYNSGLVSYASSLAADVIGTDIDNESESQVIDIVLKLVDQAESILVFISAMPDTSLGGAGKMIQSLHIHQNKIWQLVMLGKHSGAEELMQVFDKKFMIAADEGDVKKQIHNFAKNTPTPDQTSGHAP